MKDKKKLLIGTLCALIMIMAVGYALLSQQLSINGTANITSTWKIEITNITQKAKSTGAIEKSKSYDAMTANFDVGFTSPGDYILYEVEVTNSGTLDAVIESVNVVTDNNPAIIYTTSGIKRGTTIEHNTKKYLTVKIEYDSSVTSQPQVADNGITLQLFTAQNLGQVTPNYDYVIGDKITFAGSDWYVIKNSAEDEDYVTLLKENILTNSELGQWRNYSKNNNQYPFLAYYWSETCHGGYSKDYICYGSSNCYTNRNTSGCAGHNDYAGSKVKEFLEETYLPTIDPTSNKLKEVDGYKIRLITLEELEKDLGVTYGSKCTPGCLETYGLTENTPNWIYQNYGAVSSYNDMYWTMTPIADETYRTWVINDHGLLMSSYYGDIYSFNSVRPVINLYKSAIE